MLTLLRIGLILLAISFLIVLKTKTKKQTKIAITTTIILAIIYEILFIIYQPIVGICVTIVASFATYFTLREIKEEKTIPAAILLIMLVASSAGICLQIVGTLFGKFF